MVSIEHESQKSTLIYVNLSYLIHLIH